MYCFFLWTTIKSCLLITAKSANEIQYQWMHGNALQVSQSLITKVPIQIPRSYNNKYILTPYCDCAIGIAHFELRY